MMSNSKSSETEMQEKYEGKVQEMVTIENELKEKLETLMLEKQELRRNLSLLYLTRIDWNNNNKMILR